MAGGWARPGQGLGAAAEGLRSRLAGLMRGRRAPGLRTAKTVLAAVLSYALADAMNTSSAPVLAPLTALLVVQLTMYETFAHGRERIVSVVAGVLVAVLFASVTGLTWWSLGLVVAVSLVAGRLLRLGPHLPEVPISAMLVLAVGGAESAALGRVVETLVGAVVGVLVNLVVAPPLYIQPASDAIARLAERMADVVEELAGDLRAGWSRGLAQTHLTRARELSAEVARADRWLARTEESARLNPRGRLAREAEPRLRGTLTALEHAQVGLRQLARSLLDRTFFVPEEEAWTAHSPAARHDLAAVLDAMAVSLRDAAEVVSRTGGPVPLRSAVEAHLAVLKRRRDELALELLVDPRADPAAWAQHGALIDAVDRLRVELATAVSPPEGPWVSSPPAARRRPTVRRAVEAAGVGRRSWRTGRRRRDDLR